MERRNGWINVGDLQGAVHFKIVKYERIKFLVIALKDSIEIYAWAPKPYHKFMAFKVIFVVFLLGSNPNIDANSYFYCFAELRRIGSQTVTGRSHNRRSITTEGHLWIRWRFSCSWFRFGHGLRHLSSEAREYLDSHQAIVLCNDDIYKICLFFLGIKQTQGPIIPHCIVALPNSNGMQLLLCYDNEGVYVNTVGRVSKNIVLQVSILNYAIKHTLWLCNL